MHSVQVGSSGCKIFVWGPEWSKALSVMDHCHLTSAEVDWAAGTPGRFPVGRQDR